MRWKKLGKIFDPTEHALPNGCAQFAQSPQALVLDDFVRIYFSTRSVDPANGKYLSHIAFVEMSKDFRKVLRVSDKTVISLGALGCFDEHGIFPMSILRHGNAIYGYTCGWNRRVSVSVDTAIGLVVSHDGGLTFERVGPGPVLAASLHEPFLVGDGFVRVVGEVFHMWYIFGTDWTRYSADAPPDRVYKIGHAISPDGVNWTKEDGRQIVANRLASDESQALPTVIAIDGVHHMFFCYRESHDFRTNRNRGYKKSAMLIPTTCPIGYGTTMRWRSRARQASGMPTCSAIRMSSTAMAPCTCSTTAMRSGATALDWPGLSDDGFDPQPWAIARAPHLRASDFLRRQFRPAARHAGVNSGIYEPYSREGMVGSATRQDSSPITCATRPTRREAFVTSVSVHPGLDREGRRDPLDTGLHCSYRSAGIGRQSCLARCGQKSLQ